jgi:hypothetical protein
MTLTTNQLLQRLYFDRAYTETARIIGYGGVEMSAFWEQAKALGVPQGKLLNAVYDLTRADRREEKPPRYELTAPAREACWQLLGPAPEQEDAFWRHPDGTPMERPRRDSDSPLPAPDQAEASYTKPEKKAKNQRGRSR